MQIHPASSASVHAPPSTAAHPSPAQPFSSHLDHKRAATAAKAHPATSTSKPATSTSKAAAPDTLPSAVAATAPPAGTTASSPDASSVQGALDQSQDQNMQFLQMQSQMDTQSEMFTAMSNVEKTQTDTLKNTAQNMAI